jgi:hypothetical protein
METADGCTEWMLRALRPSAFFEALRRYLGRRTVDQRQFCAARIEIRRARFITFDVRFAVAKDRSPGSHRASQRD